jgi:hypothetical protein
MALARGRGICWHRVLVLRTVLRAHGVDAEPVHAFLNRFEDGLLSGHAWLIVRIAGEARWVCPDDARNEPGAVRFRPLSKVRSFGAWMVAISWLGSPIANLFLAARRLARGERLLPTSTPAPAFSARILRSGAWPLVPIVVWNATLAGVAPAALADDAGLPAMLLLAEDAGRLFTLGLAPLLVLGTSHPWQRRGAALFVVGAIAYGVSWIAAFHASAESWLWLLPYVLPVLWLLGLGLWARSGSYLVGAGLFVIAHVAHGVWAVAARAP